MSQTFRSIRGWNVFSILTAIAMVLSLWFPGSVVNSANLMATVPLAAAYVSSPAINFVFDTDGVIVVNDMADFFTPAGATGEGFLQTRLFPRVTADISTYGLYTYLYRLDLRNLVAEQAICISEVKIPFGAVAPVDYDGDQTPEDYFVISEGGALGSVAPSDVVWDNVTGEITIQFKEPVCSGTQQGGGESSYFVGFSSIFPYKDVDATATIAATGAQFTLKARSPRERAELVCDPIESPTAIPSPALINFDTLKDEEAILNAYQTSYGVSFVEGVKADSLTEAFLARSSPNVANRPYTPVAVTALAFNFAAPVSHVGFYAGNASDTTVQAHIQGYDQQGVLRCEVRGDINARDYGFFGFYDPLRRIARISVSYPQGTADVLIDDLTFAPAEGSSPTEFPPPENPLSGGGPEIIIRGSDNTHFAATFNLPDPSLWIETQDGADMPRLRFGLPGSELNSNQDGSPDIPMIRRLIALPDGSTPKLGNVAAFASAEMLADIYPSQPAALDEDTDPGPGNPNDWVNPPFTLDPAAYASDSTFPTLPDGLPAGIFPVGKMRDLNLALLVIAGGRYNPVTRSLTIFDSVDVDVMFEGGTGFFLPDYSNNPFEPAIAKQYAGVLNEAVLGNYLGGVTFVPTCQGTEFFIFTHPDFATAAETLKVWKVQKGIATQVVQTNSTTLDTPAEIKDYIQYRYDHCAVRPSYVLLLGDAEFIGAFPHAAGGYGGSTNTDLDYALMTPGDTFPDLAYGRIPVDTLDQANIVVNKIIAYEKTPPTQSSFYDTVTLASFFECCSQISNGKGWDDRSFVETSETARAALIAASKTVTRIYTTNVNINTTKPSYYRNGAALPSALGQYSTFPWNGSTTDVINAFNNGSGIIMHRDHGGPSGWGDPAFYSSNLSSLTNGNLTPVVYSINCSSGVWDNELPGSGLLATDVSWIERMLRMEGGAVGLIGDTRNSPTWANSALARGLFDATWPATDPTYGSSSVHRRLGDILNYGKLYMYAQITIPQTAGSVTSDQYEFENRIYHVIGDPTLTIWKNQPLRFLVSVARFHWLIGPLAAQQMQMAPALTVEYPVEGAVITILQDGLPVGRGTVVGGVAPITFVADYDPNKPMQASASLDDAISVEISQPVYLPLISH